MYEPYKRIRELRGEGGYVWLGKAREWEKNTGNNAVHLEIGEPDFPTPKNVIEATKKALDQGKTKYTPIKGIPELRGAVAKYFSERRKVEINPENVVIAHGLKCLIRAVMEALTDPEKPEKTAFILPDPGYAPYLANVQYTGSKLYTVSMEEHNDWRFEPDKLKEVVESVPEGLRKVLLIVSPSNPTGGVLTKEDLKFVAKLAEEHDICVISDEIYDDIVFDGEFHSIFSIPGMRKRTCLLHGASKSWAMTGYRLGWGVFPDELVPYIEKMVGHSNSCVAEFVQYAGVEALMGPQDAVKEMKEYYRRRRDYTVKALRELGCYCVKPGGAFYVFPNVSTWIEKVGAKDDNELAERMLQEIGVVCLPGSAFGRLGENHIRFSLASSLDNLKEGMERIGKWLDSGGKTLLKR